MLDKRLEKVAQYILGDTLADIGSDHAYLPIYAYENHMIKKAICGEVVNGPYESTKNNIKHHNLSSHIEARFGYGLSILHKEPVQTITICGMGGPLIANILKEGFIYVEGKPRLILQANTFTYPIRVTISKLGYSITDEVILKDRNNFYEIIVCDYYEPPENYSELEYQFGPKNLVKRTETFIDKVNWELRHQKDILAGIKNTGKNQKKIDEIKKKIREKEEVLFNES